ncbi:MAG: M23 family metallopeptidase [Anaerolineaceae bacterium]|nr:M23 family metallopeptidase [Anaerolineaceae bacterium]
MKKIPLVISAIMVVAGFFLCIPIANVQGMPLAQSGSPTEMDQVIWEAIQQEIASRPEAFLFNFYDWQLSQVTYSAEQTRAVAWLDPLDPETGSPLATEPMVAIAALMDGKPANDRNSWTIIFQDDDAWSSMSAELKELLPQELTFQVAATEPKAPNAPQAALGGYKLPWSADADPIALIWSAEHTSCPPGDCIYAFDFADGTMFPLLAAKGGTVVAAIDHYPNGDSNSDHTNLLVLEDKSTSPTSYQLYYHLAQNSIPAALHTNGAAVSQGQFIGLVDDTGYSSGHHLHFMVHTNPYKFWGKSVDITFQDVSINWDPVTQGGRPRTLAGTAILGGQWQKEYKSGNVGANPPVGGLTLPTDMLTFGSQKLATSGWGGDNIGVTRMQLIAYFNGAWHEVGEAQTANPFNYNLDVCDAGIPAGPFDLAVKVWDYEGNQSRTPQGIRHLVNAVDCPEPTQAICQPDSGQVALYSGINFSGTCRLLGGSTHDTSQLAPFSSNDAASVIMGGSVQLRLYDGTLAEPGRKETLSNSDRNLADNPIGNDRLSSAYVLNRAVSPEVFLDGSSPHGPGIDPPRAIDSITLAWQAEGATKYQASIFSGIVSCDSTGPLLTRDPLWSVSPTWSIGTLPAGNYTWCVRGRIYSGSTEYRSEWARRAFTVSAAALPGTYTRNLPFTYDVESGIGDWTSSGLWRRIPDPINTNNDLWACNNTDNDYGDSTYGGGDLTSPPIQIPAQGATLRFKYRYETESNQIFWDQRWVQISQNNGRFQNLVQLSDDAMHTWRTSPAIDLSAYAGSTVRIRFHFSIADKYYNGGLEGWLVDDVSVTATAPENCGEPLNNTIATAQAVGYGEELTGTICPAGDVDYYKFTVEKDERLIAQVKAMRLVPASLLDTHLTLLDQNAYGNSPLFSNDDMQTGLMTDSQIYFAAPGDGTYYLKVKAGDHPGSGGSGYSYTISLIEQPNITDTVPPNLAIQYPSGKDGIPSGVAMFSALADDAGSGISHVDFWWHSPNWDTDKWLLMSSDSYGADGWQAIFDGTAYHEGQKIALVVMATDWAGNTRVVSNWNVPIDDTPPVTKLNPLPGNINGNGIYLSWTATDSTSRLGDFDIQYQMDGGDWLTGPTGIPGNQRGAWFLGEIGHQYAFRMRGADRAGNQESYPPGAETATHTNGNCTLDQYELNDGDDLYLNATELVLGTYQENHNFCELDDIDWVKFNALAGQTYLITIWPDAASPLGSAVDLYQSDESNLLIHYDAPGFMSPVMMKWQAPADDLYFLRISPLLAGIMGDNTAYDIRVGAGSWFTLPLVFSP